MKKNYLILLFICIILFQLFPESEEELKFWAKDKLICYIYNETLKKFDEINISIYIKTNQKNKNKLKKDYGTVLELYFNDYLNRNCLKILPSQRLAIFDIIKKYKEWNEKAKTEKVTLEKLIGTIDYQLSWKSIYGDDWYKSSTSFYDAFVNTDNVGDKLYFTFFSQNEKEHQLVISFDKIFSQNNEYITNKPASLYLYFDNVLELEKKISDEYVNSQIDIAKKEKEKEKMFQ